MRQNSIILCNLFRIPSNPSVASKSSGGAGGISTGSIDRSVCSERDSPMPTFRVEVLNPGQIALPANKRQSLPEYGWSTKLVLKQYYYLILINNCNISPIYILGI